MTYRSDIDGLRAYAVFAVIFFHLGLLPKGYLGVDVFFVISGFLITNIINKKIETNQFTFKEFYIRRVKRILPLTSFITVFSLLVGYFIMLPDDLENLSQSVIATNFFSNNILMILTTKNYWDVVNEYKPLMHTWSLAVEEQFYFVYPLMLMATKKINAKYIKPVILTLSIISVILFFSSSIDYIKFYLLPYRFFEMSIGGFFSLYSIDKLINKFYSIPTFILLASVVFLEQQVLSDDILLLLCVILTAILLKTNNSENKISSILLNNKLIIFFGKISFSLYLWHQVILAFSRYIYGKTPLFIILIITLLLSIITYYIIEKPFRFKVSNIKVIVIVSTSTLLSSLFSYSIYKKGGIIKDFPSLGLYKSEATSGIHGAYNDRIYKLDKPFNDSSTVNILIIGNSFARDWANVLLESNFASHIEVSYIYDFTKHPNLLERAQKSDFIFWSTFDTVQVKTSGVDFSKSWCVGTKNFGENNGKFHNSKSPIQRTRMEDEYYTVNRELKAQWGDKYLDLIELVIDEDMTVPVYTPTDKFISQDCRHFTKYGARYYAELLDDLPNFPLKLISH